MLSQVVKLNSLPRSPMLTEPLLMCSLWSCWGLVCWMELQVLFMFLFLNGEYYYFSLFLFSLLIIVWWHAFNSVYIYWSIWWTIDYKFSLWELLAMIPTTRRVIIDWPCFPKNFKSLLTNFSCSLVVLALSHPYFFLIAFVID